MGVRHEPDVTSAIVGHLNKGESAKLQGSVPFWFEVTLTDGTYGFVSKAWSQVVAEAATTGDLLRLGEWNVKKLGHGTKDFALVAKIINENFDIVAIVEVMQKGGDHTATLAIARPFRQDRTRLEWNPDSPSEWLQETDSGHIAG